MKKGHKRTEEILLTRRGAYKRQYFHLHNLSRAKVENRYGVLRPHAIFYFNGTIRPAGERLKSRGGSPRRRLVILIYRHIVWLISRNIG